METKYSDGEEAGGPGKRAIEGNCLEIFFSRWREESGGSSGSRVWESRSERCKGLSGIFFLLG